MALDAKTVHQELGELDDLAVARILETAATREDLIAARAWVTGDEETEEMRGDLPDRVKVVVQILSDAEDEEEETEA